MMVFQDCHIPFYDSANGTIKHHSVKSGTALIDKSLIDGQHSQHRARFTIAHECAHWILHRPSKISHASASSECRIVCRTTDSKVLADAQQKTASDWKEWQADNLASALLMPASVVKAFMREYLENETKKSNPFIAAFGERMVIAKTTSMLRHMSAVFNVSVSAAEIRLKRLGFLSDFSSDLMPPVIENQSDFLPQPLFNDWF
jgi:Zn-dependent peptidase ImmA (M78 family)